MPQLKTGRHVGFSVDQFIDAITTGSDESKSYVIMLLRLKINSPAKLRDYALVYFYKEGEGTPPDAPPYHTGFNIGEILAGKSDWGDDEVAEFKPWLETEPKVQSWLKDKYDELDSAIKNNAVWQSPLWSEI